MQHLPWWHFNKIQANHGMKDQSHYSANIIFPMHLKCLICLPCAYKFNQSIKVYEKILRVLRTWWVILFRSILTLEIKILIELWAMALYFCHGWWAVHGNRLSLHLTFLGVGWYFLNTNLEQGKLDACMYASWDDVSTHPCNRRLVWGSHCFIGTRRSIGCGEKEVFIFVRGRWCQGWPWIWDKRRFFRIINRAVHNHCLEMTKFMTLNGLCEDICSHLLG